MNQEIAAYEEAYPIVKKVGPHILFHRGHHRKILDHEGFSALDESVGSGGSCHGGSGLQNP